MISYYSKLCKGFGMKTSNFPFLRRFLENNHLKKIILFCLLLRDNIYLERAFPFYSKIHEKILKKNYLIFFAFTPEFAMAWKGNHLNFPFTRKGFSKGNYLIFFLLLRNVCFLLKFCKFEYDSNTHTQGFLMYILQILKE